jgi:hypothetical protein
MSDDAETVPSRVIISDISPAPDAATLVAITMALEEGWPQPVADMAPTGPSAHESRWRFSQRRWQHRAVPMQTWGRQR